MIASKLGWAVALFVSAVASAQDARPVKYVRAAGTAKLLNLADKNGGSVVATVKPDTLLAVYDERAGWLSVEAPQGLEVWVYGQFLRMTSQAGIAEVTGDGVNVRPKPNASVENFPLQQQLHEGDRVRVIGRAAPDKPLSKDWVNIVSPPGIRAWVQASETSAVEAGFDADAAWRSAVKAAAPAGTAVAAGSASGSAAGAAPADDAAAPAQAGAGDAAFASAEALYEKAKAAPNDADWGAVLAAYEGYLKASPDGAMAATAQHRMREVALRGEIANLRKAATLTEAQREEKLREAQADLEEAKLSQDPLWGRFQARGWLERDVINPARWVLMWAGKPAAEVTCASGRYDLAVFQGKELGVIGTRQTSGSSSTLKLDASRIEVLSVRAR